ncbi:MAG: hypothetical protein HOP30_21605 [Cyclobacteriaceae bacterium]|nr:hypothetical protein [Cyclobacteriaceae bacterium]
MKRKLISVVIITFFVITISSAQKSDVNDTEASYFNEDGKILGIGMVELDLEQNYFGKDIIIYNVKGKTKVVIRVTVSDVTTKMGGKLYSLNNQPNPFLPRYFGNNPDYFRLIFDCVRVTSQFYEVVIDQTTNETGFIKKSDSLFKFKTVMQYVDEWTSLGLSFDRSQNPLKLEPSDHAKDVYYDNHERNKIESAEKIEMKGDWMKIKTQNKLEGWIRWKRDNTIVIQIYFAC